MICPAVPGNGPGASCGAVPPHFYIFDGGWEMEPEQANACWPDDWPVDAIAKIEVLEVEVEKHNNEAARFLGLWHKRGEELATLAETLEAAEAEVGDLIVERDSLSNIVDRMRSQEQSLRSRCADLEAENTSLSQELALFRRREKEGDAALGHPV